MQSIYVGNVSWNMTNEQLQEVFEKIGTVSSARIITDRETGRSRGFGFVEMSEDDANKAVNELNGQEVEGRELRVNLAEDKPKKTFTPRSETTPSNNYNKDNGSRDSESNYDATPSFDSFENKPRSKKNWGKSSY